jgi:hypothetical protein
MLNPFIYSLRNKDVKGALERLLGRVASFPWWISDLRIRVMWISVTRYFSFSKIWLIYLLLFHFCTFCIYFFIIT